MCSRIRQLFRPARHTRPAAKPLLAVEPLEGRDTPALLAPVTTPGGGAIPAVGDFNRDGKDDIAAISGAFDPATGAIVVNKNTVTVGRSNGDGTFTMAPSAGSVTQGYRLGGFWATDVNGDGKLGLRAVTYDRKVKYVGDGTSTLWGRTLYTLHFTDWLGNGDGTFRAPTVQTLKDQPYGVAPATGDVAHADFDRDGRTDYVRLYQDTHTVGVHLQNATDEYYHFAGAYAPGAEPGRLALGDFNGEGWTDVIVLGAQATDHPTYSVLFNDGHW